MTEHERNSERESANHAVVERCSHCGGTAVKTNVFLDRGAYHIVRKGWYCKNCKEYGLYDE